jgi:hypothetical protein
VVVEPNLVDLQVGVCSDGGEGFLAERPLPGHELRLSDGRLYPAIKRLAAADLLERRADPAEVRPATY